MKILNLNSYNLFRVSSSIALCNKKYANVVYEKNIVCLKIGHGEKLVCKQNF